MTPLSSPKTLDELTLGSGVSFEDLVDREALSEMVKSVHQLFRIPLRVFAEDGGLLADAADQLGLYSYLNSVRSSRIALADVVSAVKSITPDLEGDVSLPCVTGALYRITAIQYDGRRIGRMVVGPFVSPKLSEPPPALFAIAPELDRNKVLALFGEMPRATEEQVSAISGHLTRTLDLILFSGHRALLTSNMHMASVRESFRELEDKNHKLQLTYDRLRELDRLKSNFLATISHELRTPLTSIIGYSEMLVEGLAGELSGEQRDFVQTIRDKGEQLLQLIKGLLDLSKLESGTMSLRKDYMEVIGLVRDVVSTMAPAARKKDVLLGMEIDPGLPALWADAERLRQVLLNLTENAIKFTPPGGKVTLSARLTMMDAAKSEDSGGFVIMSTRRTAVEFRVADTGIGIPESERERVFDAFYQVDSSSTREQGGTGLGLSIVRRLVEGHDGTVHIEENKPRGSVFVVTVPCKKATIS